MVDRQRGFQRTFTLSGVPEGAEVALRANVASVAAASAIETNGAWKTLDAQPLPRIADNLSAMAVDGGSRRDGPTRFTAMFVGLPYIPNPFDLDRRKEAESQANISPGERIMASDCRTCHNPQVKTVGPGYAQIAERYKNTPENIEKLAAKVMAGGAGVWGVAAAEHTPTSNCDDAKSMVAYVLSLDEGEDDGEGGTAAKS